MPKLQHVKACRPSKQTRVCTICQHEIQVGEALKFIAKRSGSGGFRLFFCANCQPRGSHYFQGHAQTLAMVGEGFSDEIDGCSRDDPDDVSTIAGALRSASEDVQSLGEEIEQSASNIEDGFGHSTVQSEAMSDTANELSEWADKLSSMADDLDGWEMEDDEDADIASQLEQLIADAEELIGEEPELTLTA